MSAEECVPHPATPDSNPDDLHRNRLNWSARACSRWFFVIGINGAGKTTTIGKLAHYYRNQDKQVVVAAADTYRGRRDRPVADLVPTGGGGFDRAAAGLGPGRGDLRRHPGEPGKPEGGPDPGGYRRPVAHPPKPHAGIAENAQGGRPAGPRRAPRSPCWYWMPPRVRMRWSRLASSRLRPVSPASWSPNWTGPAREVQSSASGDTLGVPVRFAGVGEGLDDLLRFDPAAFAAGLFEQALIAAFPPLRTSPP